MPSSGSSFGVHVKSWGCSVVIYVLSNGRAGGWHRSGIF
jgi:hypothetical protein